MKRTYLILIVMAVLLLAVTALPAQKLARDVNGYRIQMERYFTAASDSIAATTTAYDSLAVPSNAVAVTVIFRHTGGYIYGGAAKTLVKDSDDWIYLPKDTPITLPVLDLASGYLKYITHNGANRMSYIWRRL